MIELTLPYPPTGNTHWRYGKRGKPYLTPEARRFRDAVLSELAAKNVRPLQGDIDIAITLFPPDQRRRDIDNVLKEILDACQCRGTAFGAYDDDCQIVRLSAVRLDRGEKDKSPGYTMVIIRHAAP